LSNHNLQIGEEPNFVQMEEGLMQKTYCQWELDCLINS